MKKIFLLLAAILMAQPLRAQSLDGISVAADPAGDVSYAPVNVFTNGAGRIYIMERGKTVVGGQMLPVGSRFLIVALPDPGYEFASWYPVNVFTFTEVTLDPEGNPNPPIISSVASPVPRPTYGHVLYSEVQPVTVLYDVSGVRTITQSQGWQANFEPIPLSRRRSSM